MERRQPRRRRHAEPLDRLQGELTRLEYEAVIHGELYGRFILRVNHVWLLSRETGEMLVMPAFEGTVAGEPERL